MHYILSFDVAAVFIFIVIAILFYTKKKSPYRYNFVFGILLVVCLLTAVFDILGGTVITNRDIFPLWFSYIINVIYALLQNAAAPVYAWYIVALIRSGRLTRPVYMLMLIIPYFIEMILIITTPFTHLVFYYNQDDIYLHGPFFTLIYMFALFYFLFGFYLLHKYSKGLSFDKRLALYSFLPVVGGAVVFQILNPAYLVQIFCMSISITLLLFSVQNAEELLDSMTGAFRADAFGTAVEGDLATKQKFMFLSVEISNFDMIEKNVGLEKMTIILRHIVKYLNSVSSKGMVGRLKENIFGIKMPDMSRKELETIVDKLTKRFAYSFDDDKTADHYQLRIACIACPDEAPTMGRIMEIISYVSENGKDNVIYYGEDVNQDALNKKHEIRRAIREALKKRNFEVYYQPIYSVQQKRISSAEALIRLHDEQMGFISPEIFIPIAEQEGYILEIGNFMFESVCSFYQGKKLWELGIEYIEVNLSVVECMQHDLAERLFAITEKYNLSSDKINLEITETAMASSNDVLRNTMINLTERGFTFSMDDYGTGYSNISSAYDLPFHYIKIDKSILWTSMENEKAYAVLKNTFSMAKTIEKKIIMEGVETKEHIERLLELGCDYFQGYYFSKPIPGDAFIEYLISMRQV